MMFIMLCINGFNLEATMLWSVKVFLVHLTTDIVINGLFSMLLNKDEFERLSPIMICIDQITVLISIIYFYN